MTGDKRTEDKITTHDITIEKMNRQNDKIIRQNDKTKLLNKMPRQNASTK